MSEQIHINELQIRAEAAVLDFFETYKIKHAAAPAAYPLDRRLIDWLDDLQAFLDVSEFAALGVRPPLERVIAEASIEDLKRDATDTGGDRFGAVIDFPSRD